MTLKDWMKKAGVSASVVAARVGVSRQVIYAWVEGEYLPTVRHLGMLHELTEGDVGLGDFVDKDGNTRQEAVNG